MLPLTYAPDVPANLIEILEHHGKKLGVSLTSIERIGQRVDLVERFIVAAENGYGVAFARAVEFNDPLPHAIDAAFGIELASLGVTA